MNCTVLCSAVMPLWTMYLVVFISYRLSMSFWVKTDPVGVSNAINGIKAKRYSRGWKDQLISLSLFE